jgi:hypothetical protein
MQPTPHDPSPLPVSHAMFGEHRHVCAFFDGPWEEDATLLPFLKEGLDHGERAFCIVDPASRPSYVGRLERGGIPVATAEQRGQLELRNWDDAYLRGGHFDQDAMLALIEEVLSEGKARGFPQTRLLAHMEWCLEDRPGVDDIVEY